MQFHLTPKERVQQSWEQGKCQVLPVTTSLVASSVSDQTRSHQSCTKRCLYWTCIAQNRDYQHVCSFHGHIIAVSWNHLMLSWMCLGFPFRCYCQLMSSWSCAAAVISLSAYSYYLILFVFLQSLKLPLEVTSVQSPIVLTLPHNFVLWAESNLTGKFMLFYFSKTNPFNTLMIKPFKAASSLSTLNESFKAASFPSHIITYLSVRELFYCTILSLILIFISLFASLLRVSLC